MTMIKVVHFPYQAHFLVFGGFEVQMLSAIDSVNSFYFNEIQNIKSDPWLNNLDFDIAHFWGLGFTNFDNIIWSKNNGKKIVLSVLVPFYDGYSDKIRNWLSSKFGAIKYFNQILQKVDIFTVVSAEQKFSLEKLYNISSEKIVVIPNIINEIFYDNLNKKIQNAITLPKDYIISIGNICARKNQLNTALAALDLNINAVFVGEIIEENSKTSKQFVDLLNSKSKSLFHINKLTPNSLELVSLINNSSGFVLPSYNETQPISILEALALNKPVVTSKKTFSKQYPYSELILVDPNSINSIKQGIQLMLNSKNNNSRNIINLDQFREESVASKYFEVYKKIS